MANQSASLSDRGRRKNNEDFAAFFEPADPGELRDSGSLYIVADGVGGAAKGERASQFAAQKVLYEYYQPENIDLEPLERLRLILERANDEIYDYASQNNTRMATTIVAAVVRAGFLYVANVGDSRAYLIRDGAAQQINRDHSIVGEMVEHGEMTEADAMISKIKNRITRSLGGDPEVTVEVYPPIQLKTGDKILLCSDGLTRYALREDIAKMTAQGTVEETAQRLVEFANKSGGADNVSVIMTSYQDTSVIVPTVRIARPKQVDMDTLVTQPGEIINNPIRKQKLSAVLVVILLIFSVGIVGALVTLGITALKQFNATQAPIPIMTQITPSPEPVITTSSAPALSPSEMSEPTPAPSQTLTPPTNTPLISIATLELGYSTIRANNSCDKRIFVFKTANGQDPINEAYIEPNEMFNLISVVKGTFNYGGTTFEGFWLETSGPFRADQYEIGWVFWWNNCIKFFQGTSLVILNTDTLLFETPIPNP